MKKIEWTVRIIVHHERMASGGIVVTLGADRNAGRDSWWLGEALRYAGLSARIGEFENPHREVFELRCNDVAKKGDGGKVWADQNAARLRSFGVDAAAAPRWDGLSIGEQSAENTRLSVWLNQ